MPKPTELRNPNSELVYRLRLAERLFAEVTDCSFQGPFGPACDPLAIEDMLRLNNELPVPGSLEEIESLIPKIQEVLAKCGSEQVRTTPPASIAGFMRAAFQQSERPYRPTADELLLLD